MGIISRARRAARRTASRVRRVFVKPKLEVKTETKPQVSLTPSAPTPTFQGPTRPTTDVAKFRSTGVSEPSAPSFQGPTRPTTDVETFRATGVSEPIAQAQQVAPTELPATTSQAIVKPTAQSQIPLLKDVGPKLVLDYPTLSTEINPLTGQPYSAIYAARDVPKFDPTKAEITEKGQLPLNAQQEAELRRLTGRPGVTLSPTEASFTASGKGTIMTNPSGKQKIRSDLKNTIDGQAQMQADIICKKEIDSTVTTTRGKYVNDIQSFSNDLQAQVNSGQFTMNEANERLNKYVDKQNKAYQSEVKSKVTTALKDNPNLKRIEDNTIAQYKKFDLTNLEEDLIAKKKRQNKENIRFAGEVAFEVAATVVAGPPGAVFAATAIAAGRGVSAGVELQEGTLPVYDIKYDSSGKAIDVRIAKEIVTPEAKARALEHGIVGATALGGVLIPGVSAAGGKVVLTKSIASQAIETASVKSAQELLEAQLKAGTRTLSQSEIKKGLIKVQLKDTFGKTTGQFVDIPISNLKAIKVSEDVAIRRARDIALGKGNKIKYISAGTRDEQLAINALLKESDLGGYRIGDKTVREFAEQGSLVRYRAYDVAKGKNVDFYGVRILSSVDGKGKQVDVIFKLRGGKVSQSGAKVIVTDLESGVADVFRTARLKEMAKETVKVPIPGIDPASAGPIEIFGIGRLKGIDTRLIIQKSKVQEKILDGALARKIEKEAVTIKIGKPLRGDPTKSFLQAVVQEERVIKTVDFEALTRVSAKEFQLLKQKGVKLNVDTVEESLQLLAKRGGLTSEKGVITKLPKPIVFDITKKGKPTDFGFLADDIVGIDQIIKKQVGRKPSTIIKLPTDKGVSQVLDTSKMVGGEGLVESVFTRQGLAPDETFAQVISPDILGLGKIKAKPKVKLKPPVIDKSISAKALLAPASSLIFGDVSAFEKQPTIGPELQITPLADTKTLRPTQARVPRVAQVTAPSIIQIPATTQVTQEILGQIGAPITVPTQPPVRPAGPGLVLTPPPIFGKPLRGAEQPGKKVGFPKTPRKSKFTASLASALFNIRTKVKRKDIGRLSKKLDVFQFTGAETRPLIEIVDDKKGKKTKKKKASPIDFGAFDILS